MYDMLKQNFKNPPDEFSPMPFWFLNDRLEEETLKEQIDDFYEKGIRGFVLHPRMGIPEEISYLSDAFLHAIEVCVQHAAEKEMVVVLYDEGMYPSGSAHGMVVESNPLYASRCLYPVKIGDGLQLAEQERVVATFALQFENDILLDAIETKEPIPSYELYVFVEGFTGGAIRGIHEDEEDGMPNAPKSADLLNIDATNTFLRLTHERYYEKLKAYFGKTIIGMFTDEPSLAGRGAKMEGKLSWSCDFLLDFTAYANENCLPALFFPMGEKSIHAQQAYNKAIRERLANNYYAPLSRWCKSHYIALMGHPDKSGDTGMQVYFQTPGQDLVWRMVSPEYNLESPDSVIGKCSSDMARHMEAKRNSNECFGVCGKKGNPWDFTASDMMWYLNFLFARGVNMIIPHAFYYSVRTPLQYSERPPDVGLHAVWWDDYNIFADYIKRMSWLNTNSRNYPVAAVLCSGETMPYQSVQSLYENGIDFNYLDTTLLEKEGFVQEGVLHIGRYRYSILLLEAPFVVSNALQKILMQFTQEGGKLYYGNDFLSFVQENGIFTDGFFPQNKNLRKIKLSKCGIPYYLLVNEGDTTIIGTLSTDCVGKWEEFHPFTGETNEIPVAIVENKVQIFVQLEPREAKIFALDDTKAPLLQSVPRQRQIAAIPINIETPFFLDKKEKQQYILTFEEVHDQCTVFCNDQFAGKMIFLPWKLDITAFLVSGTNDIHLEIQESAANRYGKPVPSGVVGAAITIFESFL